MSFVVTGLIWQWMLNPALGIQASVRALGWESFVFDWVGQPDMAIYALVLAGVWQGAGLVMVMLLAGMRGIDAEQWKAARIDGIPRLADYVSIMLPQLGPASAAAGMLLAWAVVKTYDIVVAMTNGGPGNRTEVPAKFIMDNLFGRQNLGLATAGATVLVLGVIMAVAPFRYAMHVAQRNEGIRVMARHYPHGPKPTQITAGSHRPLCLPFHRGTLLPAAALHHGCDLPEDHGRNPARSDLFPAGQDRLLCLGHRLVRRLHGNSPALVSASASGIRWRSLFRRSGCRCSSALSMATRCRSGGHAAPTCSSACSWPAAFIPYQIFLYPMVRAMANVGLYNSLAGIILVHVIFGLPLVTLLFRNYFVSVPEELFKAARVDGAGFWRIFFEIMLPMPLPMVVVVSMLQFTGIWNDFLLGLVFAGRDNLPMTVQLNNIVNTTMGERNYNVNMAATILTAIVPLAIYFLSGRWFVRGIAAGAVKG